MKKYKKYFLCVFLFLTVSFLAYCFLPIIKYKNIKEPKAIILKDRFGKIITNKANKYGYKINGKIDLNSLIVKSIIKIEDKDFYDNYGVSIKSKIRALISDIKNHKIVSGGSTITEQYIKNKYFIKEKRTILQKLREAFLAFIFSFYYDKNFILEKYLENAYFGNNIYGLKTASKIYFGIDDLNKLNKEQIVLLIGLIHNPGIQSIKEKNFQKYISRVKQKLNFSYVNTIKKLRKIKNIDRLPFVTNRVLEELKEKNIKDNEIKTSIDLDFSNFVKFQLNKTLKDLKDNNVTNGSVLVIDPKTMQVLVYLGSKDYFATDIDGQFDVIKAKRQPGSTLKPFLYLLALKSGADIDKLIIDIVSKYNSFKKNKVYISQNYSLKQYGLIRFKKALANSLNNASVRLARELGLEKVWNFFKKYGINLDKYPEYYGFSLVLGNPSISLENLVTSYINLLPDYKVKSRKITFLYNFKNTKKEKNNIDSEKFLLYQILKNPDNRDISFGVNSILNTSIFQAVKTGTSSDFRDNWIISYNPDLIVGIWLGNNDNSSMKNVTGITGAGYLWHQIIEYAIQKNLIQEKKYKIPRQIEKFYYCLDKECLRRQISYKKKTTKYFSRIYDKIYDRRDIFEKLDNYELKILKNLGFNIN